MKFEHIVAYKNISDKFDNGHFGSISRSLHLPQFKSEEAYTISRYVHLIKAHNIYEYGHA